MQNWQLAALAGMVVVAAILATLVAYWMSGECPERITIGSVWKLAGC